jgi:hypothetical protein
MKEFFLTEIMDWEDRNCDTEFFLLRWKEEFLFNQFEPASGGQSYEHEYVKN